MLERKTVNNNYAIAAIFPERCTSCFMLRIDSCIIYYWALKIFLLTNLPLSSSNKSEDLTIRPSRSKGVLVRFYALRIHWSGSRFPDLISDTDCWWLREFPSSMWTLKLYSTFKTRCAPVFNLMNTFSFEGKGCFVRVVLRERVSPSTVWIYYCFTYTRRQDCFTEARSFTRESYYVNWWRGA